MKKFETPYLNVEKFDLVNIVTTSGEVPAEKAQATELAAANFGSGDGQVNVAQTFTITL